MAPRSLLPGSERRSSSSRRAGRVVIRLSCNEVRNGEPYKAVLRGRRSARFLFPAASLIASCWRVYCGTFTVHHLPPLVSLAFFPLLLFFFLSCRQFPCALSAISLAARFRASLFFFFISFSSLMRRF